MIPYRSPIDRRIHRYFVDFYLKTRGGTYLIEVKPSRFTKPPAPRKKTKKYLQEVAQWGINEAKWKSAQEFCEDRGWMFKIITEKDFSVSIINSPMANPFEQIELDSNQGQKSFNWYMNQVRNVAGG